MTIWLFPIEPLEERYSEQWYRWFPDVLRRLGEEVVVVDGKRLASSITQGEFLDVIDTHHYKATQLAAFTKDLRSGRVASGDTVLLLDAWNPAITSLAYMRDLGTVHFKLAGCWHAGSYDPWDFLSRSDDFVDAAAGAEQSWLDSLDVSFVATEFHRSMLASKRGRFEKIRVTGFPLYVEWAFHNEPWSPRPRRVVFPHRLAPEKAPYLFDQLRDHYVAKYGETDTEWVYTKKVCQSKAEYYTLLGNSRVAVSFAKQETWGIAMLEAASLGCYPITPPALSYPEIFGNAWTASSIDDYARQVHHALAQPLPYDGGRLTDWENAIGNMLEEIKRLQ